MEQAELAQGSRPTGLRALYHRLLTLAGRPNAERWLALIAFIDGALFTLPPEILQLPMSIAKPQRSLRYAAVGTVASALGAILAYLIGSQLFVLVAQPILHFTGREAEFAEFATKVADNVLLWPLAFLIAPMPAAMAAGSVHFGLVPALVASVIGRGARFFAFGLLIKRYGVQAEHLIERHFHRVALVVAVLLAAFVIVRYAL